MKYEGEGETGKMLSKYLFHVKHPAKMKKYLLKTLENSCKIEKVVLYYG